jgi:hypothetical protein
MGLTAKHYLGGVLILFLAVPSWAGSENTRTYTAHWTGHQGTKIGNTQIKPGEYTLKALENDNTLDVMQDGKVVAQVPCHWIQLAKKAPHTQVSANNDQIIQVEFEGRTEAIQFQ